MNNDIKKALQKVGLQQIEQGINNICATKITHIEQEHLKILYSEFKKLEKLILN